MLESAGAQDSQRCRPETGVCGQCIRSIHTNSTLGRRKMFGSKASPAGKSNRVLDFVATPTVHLVEDAIKAALISATKSGAVNVRSAASTKTLMRGSGS
jgi:hypothetical protein